MENFKRELTQNEQEPIIKKYRFDDVAYCLAMTPLLISTVAKELEQLFYSNDAPANTQYYHSSNS